MNHEELPLTPEELERYFLLEAQIEKYNTAIDAMIELVDNGLFQASLGRQTLDELRTQRSQKEHEFEALQSKE